MAFYRRLMERGKPHKVALIAAMRKLLTAVYSAQLRKIVAPSSPSSTHNRQPGSTMKKLDHDHGI
jgi:hypothetical protein